MKSTSKLLSLLLIITMSLVTYGCMDQSQSSESAASENATNSEYQASSMDEAHLSAPAPGLAIQMKYIQHWTHKLGLSVDAENTELMEFYHHELEEGAEDLINSITEYDGFPIATLAEAMLVPQIKAFETAEESGDWDKIRDAYKTIISSCNSCHVATDHGYIVITDGFGNNPFNQDFSAK